LAQPGKVQARQNISPEHGDNRSSMHVNWTTMRLLLFLAFPAVSSEDLSHIIQGPNSDPLT
jgi:hypothetical protein